MNSCLKVIVWAHNPRWEIYSILSLWEKYTCFIFHLDSILYYLWKERFALFCFTLSLATSEEIWPSLWTANISRLYFVSSKRLFITILWWKLSLWEKICSDFLKSLHIYYLDSIIDILQCMFIIYLCINWSTRTSFHPLVIAFKNN
jgi:hypothetical protein